MTTAGSLLDLAGTTVVVAGTDPALVELVRKLVRENAFVAVVSTDRVLVSAAIEMAESTGTPILGLASDPAVAEVWNRNRPHIEQRLGPIDAAIAFGPVAMREQVAAAILPDMRQRRHGVFVELDTDVQARELGDGLLHGCIRTENMDAHEVVAAVVDALGQQARGT